MRFTKESLDKSKTITILKQGVKSVTSLIEYKDGNKYVIKKFNPENSADARIEYLFLQTVTGENIVKAIDFLLLEEPIIVLEYIEGETLSEASYKKWKEYETCFAQLAYTISIVHSFGICLNDIKPDNILLHNNIAYVTDMGLASVNLFFERNFRGTPAYAAPEKFIRQTNHFASDIFSLGMTMFFCKHGKTIMDIIGEEEYQKVIVSEELWQKQLAILENENLISSMLHFSPSHRPKAIEIAAAIADKNKLTLKSIDKAYIESYVFKSQNTAVEKLWKKKTLYCDYADEPQIIENLLSLWSESDGKKLLVLDESAFVSQPEEFFKSFPFGYREKNIYQPHFIEWLEEQPISILLRRNKQLNPTSFFDDIHKRTDALQLWIGTESELKPVTTQEINGLITRITTLKDNLSSLKKLIKSAKPFHIRLVLLSLLLKDRNMLKNNELADFLAWIKVALPLVLVEKVWENWYILVQDGLLNKRIIFESNVIRSESRDSASKDPGAALINKAVELAAKSGFNNIAGEICYLTNKSEKALGYWTQYVDDLTKNEYFLSAFEFVRQLRKRVKDFPFELQKKEAFLARICGHFELSNKMYMDLIGKSDGLLKAVLSVDQAIVLQALKRYDEAIVSYKNAIELFRLHKDTKSLFRAMNNLGVVYFGLQRYTDAEQLFNDVLNEAKQNKNIQFEAISYLNLSDVQLKRGEWKRVLYYTDKAISITYDNQKWNLYANGNVIKSRALFALGEYEQAVQVLCELKDNPKVNENLLQYQEILAWLLHFYEIYEPATAYELVDNIGLNDSTMHEILRRELFFINLSRKRFLQAYNYLQELSEVAILKAFFNSDFDFIIDKLSEMKTQSELDSYLYYLLNFIRLFPEIAYARLNDDIQEAINLFTFKPFAFLLNNKDILTLQSNFWAELITNIENISELDELIRLLLKYMQKIIKADKYIYLNSQNNNLVSVAAIDESGNQIQLDKLLLSENLLNLLSQKEGYFYLYPAHEFVDGDAHSSVLGLGILTVCGYSIKQNGNLKGIFYSDSGQNTEFKDSNHSMCKIFFFIAENAINNLNREDICMTKADITELLETEMISQTIIGKSKVMREVYSKISLVGEHNVNVLITGPTGSGKELVAREIHRQYIANNNTRMKTPFIAVNCAAIPEQLLESELFGYKKGAFTGAVMDKKGKLLLADNGTIFLDEIGEMPILLQSKLLRVIQDKVITPLGSDQDIPVNVRIIAASNQNLEEMIAKNLFRADLYYRLKVMTIDLPSLTERKDDIPLLTVAFLKKFNEKFHKNVTGIHPATLNYLQNKEWKGNVRELENEIERAVLICNREYLGVEDFTADADASTGSIFRNLPLQWQQFKDYKKRIEDELEKRYISILLDESENNIMTASKLGNLDRMQVYRLMKKKKE